MRKYDNDTTVRDQELFSLPLTHLTSSFVKWTFGDIVQSEGQELGVSSAKQVGHQLQEAVIMIVITIIISITVAPRGTNWGQVSVVQGTVLAYNK